MKIKEYLTGYLGIFGYILFYILVCGCIVVPLFVLGWAWWLRVIIIAAMLLFSGIAGIASMVFWIWSFVVILNTPFSTSVIVVYSIVGVFYLLVFFIPSVIRLISGFSRS